MGEGEEGKKEGEREREGGGKARRGSKFRERR